MIDRLMPVCGNAFVLDENTNSLQEHALDMMICVSLDWWTDN